MIRTGMLPSHIACRIELDVIMKLVNEVITNDQYLSHVPIF